MQIQSKYRGVKGFVRLYNYAYKQNYMITKTAKQRHNMASRPQLKPLEPNAQYYTTGGKYLKNQAVKLKV